MKYSEWSKRNGNPPDLSRGNPIYCPCCGKLVGYDKDYMFMVLRTPVVCPKCDEVVIEPNIITY